jgi:hypothetical protein
MISDPVWVRKPKQEKISNRNGRITIFDERTDRAIVYRDDSLDKASRMKCNKLETVR